MCMQRCGPAKRPCKKRALKCVLGVWLCKKHLQDGKPLLKTAYAGLPQHLRDLLDSQMAEAR